MEDWHFGTLVNSMNVIHWAAASGDDKVLKAPVDVNAHLNCEDASSDTPLMKVVEALEVDNASKKACIQTLVHGGAGA